MQLDVSKIDKEGDVVDRLLTVEEVESEVKHHELK